MSLLRNLKRAFVWFSIEVTLLSIGYCLLVLWTGVAITSFLLGDALLFAFLAVLFLLDYAVASGGESGHEELPSQIPPVVAQTKKELPLVRLESPEIRGGASLSAI